MLKFWRSMNIFLTSIFLVFKISRLQYLLTSIFLASIFFDFKFFSLQILIVWPCGCPSDATYTAANPTQGSDKGIPKETARGVPSSGAEAVPEVSATLRLSDRWILFWLQIYLTSKFLASNFSTIRRYDGWLLVSCRTPVRGRVWEGEGQKTPPPPPHFSCALGGDSWDMGK